MLGLRREKNRGEVTLPEVMQKGGAFGGCLSYPADKKGNIINEEAGYHHFELLRGEDKGGELTVAVLGVRGASKYILTDTFDRLPRPLGYGYHDLEITNGQLTARNGAVEYDLGSWPPEGIDQ